MVDFLTGPALHKAVEAVAKSRRLRCAVAFWGNGAENLIGGFRGRDIKIICNLNHMGTNPRVIERFPRACVRRNDALHAKVYIGDAHTVVTSANASADALGFDGIGADGWIEAGIKFRTSRKVIDWFDRLWTVSGKVSDADIEAAAKAWLARPKMPRRPLRVVSTQSDGRRWTREACFEHFGAICKNPRWSWSARSLDGRTVVMTMWEDEIRWDGPKATYQSRARARTRKRAGETERLENLKWARDHCDGLVRVVRMTAQDENANPRSIATCYPDNDLVMRVVALDETDGTFRAESIPDDELPTAMRRRVDSGGATGLTFEDHASYIDATMRPILLDLRDRVRRLDDRLTERCTSEQRITYHVPGNTDFLEVKVQRAAFLVRLKIEGGPAGITSKIPASFKWPYKSQIKVRSQADLEAAMPYVEAAYRARR